MGAADSVARVFDASDDLAVGDFLQLTFRPDSVRAARALLAMAIGHRITMASRDSRLLEGVVSSEAWPEGIARTVTIRLQEGFSLAAMRTELMADLERVVRNPAIDWRMLARATPSSRFVLVFDLLDLQGSDDEHLREQYREERCEAAGRLYELVSDGLLNLLPPDAGSGLYFVPDAELNDIYRILREGLNAARKYGDWSVFPDYAVRVGTTEAFVVGYGERRMEMRLGAYLRSISPS